MGKSKHRKDHKKKVSNRNKRIQEMKNKLNKEAKSYFRAQEAAKIALESKEMSEKEEKTQKQIEADKILKHKDIYMSEMTKALLNT